MVLYQIAIYYGSAGQRLEGTQKCAKISTPQKSFTPCLLCLIIEWAPEARPFTLCSLCPLWSKNMKTVAKNRRAHFKYHVLEVFEAGLVLSGPEIKSVRAGQVNLEDAFGRIDNEEVYLWNAHISIYKQGSLHVVQEPTRRRKILLHKDQIHRIMGKLSTKGLTLVPLEIYLSDSGYAKVRLGLCKGKLGPDKRQDKKKKDVERELRRNFSGRHRIK